MVDGDRKFTKSSDDVEQQLWARWLDRQDLSARNLLIEKHITLAQIVASKIYRLYGPVSVDLRDLVQAATMGLLESIDRYDPGKGAKFSTYASKRMRGAVMDVLDQYGEAQAQSAFRKRVRKERIESLSNSGARSTRRTIVFEEMVELALDLAIGYMLEDSSVLVSGSKQSASAYDTTEIKDIGKQLMQIVDELPEREAQVIRLHYYYEMGFVEIAKMLEVSRSRISQIHANGLKKIRKEYENYGEINILG